MSETIESKVKEYSLKEKQVAMDITDLIAGYHIDLDPETAGAIRGRNNKEEDIDHWKYWMTKNIVGRMLTVVDSVVEDKERREAIKSLVRQMIQQERVNIVDLIYNKYKTY